MANFGSRCRANLTHDQDPYSYPIKKRPGDPVGAKALQDVKNGMCFFKDEYSKGQEKVRKDSGELTVTACYKKVSATMAKFVKGKGNESKDIKKACEDAERDGFSDDHLETFLRQDTITPKSKIEAIKAYEDVLEQGEVWKLTAKDMKLGKNKEWWAAFQRLRLEVALYEDLHDCPAVKKYAAYRRMHENNTKSITDDKGLERLEQTPLPKKIVYIIFPMFVFFCAFAFQSYALHIATHYYIKYMEEGSADRRQNGGMLYDVVGELVAGYLCKGGKPKFGFYTCHDVGEGAEGAVTQGSVAIPLWILDATGVIPGVMCLITSAINSMTAPFNIGLWYQTFIVASCMAVLKGVFDAVTIMPDSIGWASCQTRLDGHMDVIRNMHFGFHFLEGLGNAMVQEIKGDDGARVRYCADMMVSGHTYFAVLFSMSAYRQVKYNVELIERKNNRKFRCIVGVILTLNLCCEMVFVAVSRFHYTVDMLVAVVLVLLLFDSTHIEQLAADWSEGYRWRDKYFEWKLVRMMKWLFTCGMYPSAKEVKQRENDEVVVPSQARGVHNYRHLSGCAPWEHLDDAADSHEPDAEKALE